MRGLQPVRGTQDLLPEAARRHRHVKETARAVAALYGFAEIATPIFEFTDVFVRPIGETSDIVTKETYTFTDRGGAELTLRPENTAGVVRAILSNGLVQQTPLKFYYEGPMFRYERPQKGRFRQFHQIGVELIGVALPQADIEIIALGQRILMELGIGHRVRLKLNTLGDPESRAGYRTALVSYFSSHRMQLSEDSRRRLETNPLRILDSKDPGDVDINSHAPPFEDYLSETSRSFFARVCEGLDRTLHIKWELDRRLVRGLDYYTHTVFEFVTDDLGAQSAVLAGGRYDGLVELMGGPPMPGIGWAAGVERLALMIREPPPARRPVAMVPVGERGEFAASALAEIVRDWGLPVELGYSGNLSRRMRAADRAQARVALLIGDDELDRQVVKLRDLDGGEQEEIEVQLEGGPLSTDGLGRLRHRLQEFYG